MTTKQDAPVKKAAGFYVGILAALLCIASAAVYGAKFKTIQYKEPVFNSNICTLLIAAAVVALILLFIRRLDGFAPVILCAASGISFLMYVRLIIWPVADTIYGIEPFQHMDELILCGVLLVVSFLFSEVSLYLKKTKAPKSA